MSQEAKSKKIAIITFVLGMAFTIGFPIFVSYTGGYTISEVVSGMEMFGKW